MAIVKAQSNVNDTGFSSGTTITCTFANPLTPGSKLIVYATCSSNVSITVTDTAGLTWTTQTPHFNAGIPAQNGIAWADNPASSAGSVVVTATFGASNTSHTIGIAEYTGLATGAVDVASAGKSNASSTSAPDVAMVTVTDGDLIISCISAEGATISAGAGATLIGTNATSSTAWSSQTQTTHGSITSSFTLSGANQTNVISAAFKPAAGAAAYPFELLTQTPRVY